MNQIGYIYKITNLITGKIYVGKTKTPIEHRFKCGHVWQALKHPDRTSIPLQNAIRKYGADNFSIEVIEECPLDNLNDREKFWIAELDTRNPDVGYNVCQGGDGGTGGPHFKGHQHSDETKKKMSVDRQGEKNANYGNRWKQSDELKHLHSVLSSGENNGMYGKSHSEETKKKIGLANSRYWMTNGEEDIRVLPDDAELYIMAGYRRGRSFPQNKKDNSQ